MPAATESGGTSVSPIEDKGLQQIAASVLTPVELDRCRGKTVGRFLFGLSIVEKKLLDELRDGIAGKQASEDVTPSFFRTTWK